MGLRRITAAITSIIGAFFVGTIGAFLYLLVPTLTMKTHDDSEYEQLLRVNWEKDNKRINLMFNWNKTEDCIFHYETKDKKNVLIDFTKDIIYYVKCGEDKERVCFRTVDGNKYSIVSSEFSNENRLMNRVNTCSRIKAQESREVNYVK